MTNPLPIPTASALNDDKGQTTRDGYKYFESLEKSARALNATATALKTGAFCFFITAPQNQDYLYVNIPFALTVLRQTTICSAGTATVVAKINTTAVTGLSNAASTSEVTNTASAANSFAAGDDMRITVSSVSSCLNLAVTIDFTRV